MRFVLPGFIFSFFSVSMSFAEIEVTSPSSEAASLYELGLGVGAAWLPHYPGSDQTQLFVLPLPYIIYRGNILRSDREEGTRARFFHSENLEFTLSGGGAFPVSSSGNVARSGMPDLGWIGEAGPKVSYRFPMERPNVFRLGWAVRGVFASTSNGWTWPKHLGTLTEVELDYDRDHLFGNLDLLTSYSARFATEGVHSYFYEVPEAYSQDGRPTYRAAAGYLFSTVSLGLGFETEDGRQKFYAGGSYDFLDGAANVSSPLLKNRANTTFAVGYIFVLKRSEAKAK